MSESKKREWTVPEDLTERLRQGVYVPVDREEIQQAEYECEVIKHRLGGVIKSAPLRVKVDDQWLVVGHSYQWESYAPGMTIDVDAAQEVTDSAPDLADEAPVAEPALN